MGGSSDFTPVGLENRRKQTANATLRDDRSPAYLELGFSNDDTVYGSVWIENSMDGQAQPFQTTTWLYYARIGGCSNYPSPQK